MPAPVEFVIRIASLPPGFSGDPQALATAIAERLIITPSEPWSSFINGGAQPSSNVGPFLAGGIQWKVWSDALGTYTFQTLDGTGLVSASVKRDAMQDGTPGTVFIYDAAGRPAMISGLPGQQVVVGSDLIPKFGYTATGVYFSLQLSTPFSYMADSASHTVPWDFARFAVGVTPDLASFRMPVTAGSVWFFFASLQIDSINGATTNATHGISIRPGQLDAIGMGSLLEQVSATSQQGINTSGLFQFTSDTWVDVIVASDSSTKTLDFAVSPNGNNTRFCGFRLV